MYFFSLQGIPERYFRYHIFMEVSYLYVGGVRLVYLEFLTTYGQLKILYGVAWTEGSSRRDFLITI